VTAFDYERVVWGGGGVIEADAPDFLDHSLHLRWALEALRDVRGAVVEVGCGSGRFIASVQAARPDLRCHGVDLSQTAITQARERKSAVTFDVSTAERLPFGDGALSAVLMIDVLEHLPDVRAGLAEVRRVLAPAGVFHLVFPCEGHPLTLVGRVPLLRRFKAKHAGHLHALSPWELFEVLQGAGLRKTSVRYSYFALGQLYDAAVFTALGVGVDMHRHRQEQVEVDGGSLTRRVRGVVSRVLHAESSLLSRLPLGMTAHVTARR
jgi:ubiquinone/menaquinone biosynthesis C-methylase UbiE